VRAPTLYIAFASLLAAAEVPAPTAAPAPEQAATCWAQVGRVAFYGSAEQVARLQKLIRARSAKTCPRLGLSFSTPERAAVLVYDREAGVVIRAARWTGDPRDRVERWGGASDRAILAGNPGDGFTLTPYEDTGVRSDEVPPALRQFARRFGGSAGTAVP
jgi:hypothetical protein